MSARLGLTVGAALLLAGIVGGLVWQRMHATPGPGEPGFVPNRDNDKVLVVSGWSGAELEKILADFTRLYREQLRADFAYEVRAEGALQKATFPRDLQPWLLLYLVNYAQYPKGFTIEGRAIAAAATATLSPDFVLPAQVMYGRKAVFYVPANDGQYDLVYAHAGDETWEIGVATGEWKAVQDARLPLALAALLPGSPGQ